MQNLVREGLHQSRRRKQNSIRQHLHAAAAGLALQERRLRLVDVDLELLLHIVVDVEDALQCERGSAVVLAKPAPRSIPAGAHSGHKLLIKKVTSTRCPSCCSQLDGIMKTGP